MRAALVAARNQSNGGLNLDMWGTIVDRDGVVCAVAFTGNDRDDQWPGSRVISAQKANTANAFSLRGLALSTANLFTAVQPGGSPFGLQESNPVSNHAAYSGNPDRYGRSPGRLFVFIFSTRGLWLKPEGYVSRSMDGRQPQPSG